MSARVAQSSPENGHAPPSMPTPHVVGSYIVGPTIGKGYFAKVKRAEDVYKQVYALKCFDKERISKSAHSLKQVEKEINALRLCNHPNVVQFHEVLEVEDTVYLVMELIPHGELFDYIKKRGRLTEPEAAYLAKQIVGALDYCHRNGIVHRDLKPENILIDENNNAKLVDFGLATFYVPHDESSGEAVHGESDEAKMTLLQTQCGSPHYAAPEVLLGLGYYGPSADVWSLGVLFFAMITGSLPFTARAVPQLVQKIVSGVYKFAPNMSRNARSLVSSMLKVNPKDRLTVKEIMEHPWFTETPAWTPPNAPATSSSSSSSSSTSSSAGSSSGSSSKKESKCRSCGRRLNVRTDKSGRIILSSSLRPTNPDGSSSSSSSSSSSASPSTSYTALARANAASSAPGGSMDDDELCHCTNPLWTDGLDASGNNEAKLLPPVKYLSEAEIAKMAPSKRELALVNACETGDLKKVREILYEAPMCPHLGKPRGGSTSSTSTSSSSSSEEKSSSVTSPTSGAADEDTVEETLNIEDFNDFRSRGACGCPDHQHRLDLRAKTMDNWSAVHYAARKGHADILEELILSCLPLEINALTRNNWTPLMMAADKGHLNVVELLLKYRADIHQTTTDGKTAIFLARESQHPEISRRLTEASSVRHLASLRHAQMATYTMAPEDSASPIPGAVSSLSSASGASGTSFAASASGSASSTPAGGSTVGAGGASSMSRTMSVSGSSGVDMRRAWIASTPQQHELFSACENGDLTKVKRLLPLAIQLLSPEQANAVINSVSNAVPSPAVDLAAKGTDNWTLCHFIARKGHAVVLAHIVDAIFKAGHSADWVKEQVNFATKSGWTPLMMAADRGHTEVVKLLLRYGADPSAATARSETALSLVKSNGGGEPYAAIAKLLEDAMKAAKSS